MKTRHARQIRFGIQAAKLFMQEGQVTDERRKLWYIAMTSPDRTYRAFRHTLLKNGYYEWI